MTDKEEKGQPADSGDSTAQGEASGLPPMPPWWEYEARRHAHRAMAYPTDFLSGSRVSHPPCACVACTCARREGWTPPEPTSGELVEIYAEDAIDATVRLSRVRGTPAADMARDVATCALFALWGRADPTEAAAVERMHRAIHGAEGRGDRPVVYRIRPIVQAALMWRATGGEWKARAPVALRAKVAELWPEHVEKLTESDLAAWLDDLLAKQIEISGAVARILVAMRIGTFNGVTVEVATKRVDEALRVARVRDGKHVVKPRKSTPKKRAKRIKSTAKR